MAARRGLPSVLDRDLLHWQLRALPVCGTTERELERWLAAAAAPGSLQRPMGVLATRQRFAHGQRGRPWSSPAGGVWLSAALPWPARPERAAAPGLAMAVGLSLQLEDLGLRVGIKWPNDLLLETADGGTAKLAGLLSGFRLGGGSIRWARIGVGLNGRNPVPIGATNLIKPLGWKGADPVRLGARVLAALEWAVACSDQPELVRQMAESRLRWPAAPIWEEGKAWQVQSLTADGALVMSAKGEKRVLRRPSLSNPEATCVRLG